MRFTGFINSLKLDVADYEKRVRKHMLEQLREAAREWLKVTAVAIVPVWSGASRRTFLRLASAAQFALSIGRSPGAPNRSGLGESKSKGGFIIGDHEYYFHYSTTLDYLIYNEFNNANATLNLNLRRPGPYNFQKIGLRRFKQFAKDVRLPNPWDSLVTKRKDI